MIEKIHLTQIRNYSDVEFNFSPLTIIVGYNGSGKSNIIESLYFLSSGKSFFAQSDKEMIQFNQSFGRIKSGAVDVTLIDGSRLQKQLRINGKTTRLIDVFGVSPCVLFTPDSLLLIKGPPTIRRQYIDVLLSSTNKQYIRQLVEYQHILKQRNEILRQIMLRTEKMDTLYLWDDMLVSSSLPIILLREKLWLDISNKIKEIYRLTGGKTGDKLTGHYYSSVDKKNNGLKNEISIEKIYRERLRERRAAEISIGRTLVGPHRDDFELCLNNKPISLYGSRGEVRSATITMKLFEYDYIKTITEKSPTLLFDDIFSEFDDNRKQAVLNIIPEAQRIFTSVSLDQVKQISKEATIINLNH